MKIRQLPSMYCHVNCYWFRKRSIVKDIGKVKVIPIYVTRGPKSTTERAQQ